MRNLPGPSSTAPRKPCASTLMEATRSSAACISAVSSPPVGRTRKASGTSGTRTPPPP